MKKPMKMVLSAWCLVLGAEAARAAELPEGYTAVEYIESTKGGGQFIDTGYTANGQTKVVFDAVIPARGEQEDQYGVLFGTRTMNDWATKAFALQMCDGNSGVDTVRFVYNGAYRQDGSKPFSFGERVTVTCDGQHIEWTGSKAASVEFSAESLASSKSTLYIFADNTVEGADGAKNPDGMNHSVMRLYSFKIYEGEDLVRDFVPCFGMQSQVAGLYDTVGQKFYENAGTGMIGMPSSALPFARELTSGTYEINESFAFAAPKMESALKIADGATVTLKIAAGVTVELRGGDAFEVWGGGAGIEVPANAKLYVVGEGTLKAFGGKGANGCNGVDGGMASGDEDTGNSTSGVGGAGGWGGGGAGAGIGSRGASGGGGGNGGKAVTSYDWEHTDRDGQSGDDGGAGKNSGMCGAVSIGGTVTVNAHGGAAGDADGAGGEAGWIRWLGEGSTYWFSAFGGGGGGGGAKGNAAADIGGGGAGGYGGGGGGSGAYAWGVWSTLDPYPGWGAGGKGANDGLAFRGTSHGGAGGAKGAAGSRGGCRSLIIAETATVVADALGCYCVVWNSEQDYILMEQDKLYHVVNGVRSELTYTTVDANTPSLETGWYIVKGVVSRGTITVNGSARLILWDGCNLEVTGVEGQPGLGVWSPRELEIFGGPMGSGRLTAQGGFYGAGIGGGNDGAGGTVTIYGGQVTAKGGWGGAGIGGGFMGAGGNVTINGGQVTAYGFDGGESIGGGRAGGRGSLTLGPRVRKIDDSHYCEGVTVSFEIPAMLHLAFSRTDEGPLIMTEDGASRTAFFLPGQCLTLGFQIPGFEWRLEGDAEVPFGPFFMDDVIDASQLPKVVEAERPSVDYALPNGETARVENVVVVYSADLAQPIGQGGWYVVTGEVMTATIEVNGVANLILADGAKLTVNGGIGVDAQATLNIYGQSDGTGMLIANGVRYCAGIGGRNPNYHGGYGNCGTVTINGGVVMATGGSHGAGIGGGCFGAGGSVTINGGSVTATSSEFAAGIGGGGSGGAGGTVTINGGSVTATGNWYGAGIGGDDGGSDCTVAIYGGTVTATGGKFGAGIGGDVGGSVTLGENVGVIEGAVGNGSGYVKIGPITDVLKTEVETFDSDWYVTVPRNVYVNTHFKPDSNTRVTMDVKVQGTSEYWFGCWDANWNDGAFALGNDGGEVYCGYGSGATCGGIKDKGVIPSGRVTVALEKGVVYTNDEVWSAAHQSDATFALTNNLYLFAQNRNGTLGVGGSQDSIICFGCSISTNSAAGASIPVRNFVPARTKDERQIVGLYDTVTGDFYVPRGGTLTLGHDEILVTVGQFEHMTAAWTSGDGAVTNAINGTAFEVPKGTTNVKVIFSPEHNYQFVDAHETGVRVLDSPLMDGCEVTPPQVEGITGTVANPWSVGDWVTAYVNDDGTLVIGGTGVMDDFASAADAPWNEIANDVTEVTIAESVTHVGKNAFAGMENLTSINGEDVKSTYRTVSTVNGKPIEQFNMMEGALGYAPLAYPSESSVLPSGAISGAEFEQVQIIDGKAYLDVSVYTSDTLTNQNWSVATNGVIIVPAPGKQGFFYLMSKPAVPSNKPFVPPPLPIEQ